MNTLQVNKSCLDSLAGRQPVPASPRTVLGEEEAAKLARLTAQDCASDTQAARHMPCMRGACSLGCKAVLQNCTISVVSNSEAQLCSTTLLTAYTTSWRSRTCAAPKRAQTNPQTHETANINSSQARTHAAAHHWQATALPETQAPLKPSHSPTVETRRLQRLHGSTAAPKCSVLYHCTSVVLV